MESIGKPDTKQYLQELISHYQQHLESSFWKDSELYNLIQEELYKCTYKLHKIKEADMRGMMLAKSFQFPLDSTNYI